MWIVLWLLAAWFAYNNLVSVERDIGLSPFELAVYCLCASPTMYIVSFVWLWKETSIADAHEGAAIVEGTKKAMEAECA